MARLIGKNLNLFSVASVDYVALIRTCTLNLSYETQENRALNDSARYLVPTVQDWSIDFTVALDSGIASDLMALIGQEVAFDVEGASTANAGTEYSGTGLLNQGRHEIPDDLQQASFTIEPRGALTVGDS